MSKLSGRLLIQRCDKAILKNIVNDKENGDNVHMVSINKGAIIYIAFLKGASSKTVEQMVKTICSVNLFNSDNNPESVDIGSLPGDVLLVPHFCLGGKLRGKSFQYHGVADKACAENLFLDVFNLCREKLLVTDKWKAANCKIEHGVYGARQDINAEMNGPMSHIIDFHD